MNLLLFSFFDELKKKILTKIWVLQDLPFLRDLDNNYLIYSVEKYLFSKSHFRVSTFIVETNSVECALMDCVGYS